MYKERNDNFIPYRRGFIPRLLYFLDGIFYCRTFAVQKKLKR